MSGKSQEEKVKYSGILVKRNNSKLKKDHQRHFFLEEKWLSYYVNEEKNAKDLKGKIDFSTVTALDPGDENEPHIFTITSKDKKYSLESESYKNKNKWVAALDEAIKAVNGGKSVLVGQLPMTTTTTTTTTTTQLINDPEQEFPKVLEQTDEKNTQDCYIIVIGLSQHGKSTTLNTIFGEELFPPGTDGRSKTVHVQEKRHPKVDRLVFMDTPGVSDTVRNDEEIFRGIMKHRKRRVDAILVCRRFTHPQTKDYMNLKKLVSRVSKNWPNAPVILVYTRASDKPDMNIVKSLSSDVEKYQASPYNYKRKAAKFAAFRNLRIWQAKQDKYHAVFFFENQAGDNEWKLPDGSVCLDPLVNFLAQLSPVVKFNENITPFTTFIKNPFFDLIRSIKSVEITLPAFLVSVTSSSTHKMIELPNEDGVCHACTFKNDPKNVDCKLCKAPLLLAYMSDMLKSDIG